MTSFSAYFLWIIAVAAFNWCEVESLNGFGVLAILHFPALSLFQSVLLRL